MYIQNAPSEITKNHIYVSIFTGQALQTAGTGTRKRLIKLKPFFSMHMVIYCQSPIKPPKLAKKHIGGFPARRPTYMCGQMDNQMPN